MASLATCAAGGSALERDDLVDAVDAAVGATTLGAGAVEVGSDAQHSGLTMVWVADPDLVGAAVAGGSIDAFAFEDLGLESGARRRRGLRWEPDRNTPKRSRRWKQWRRQMTGRSTSWCVAPDTHKARGVPRAVDLAGRPQQRASLHEHDIGVVAKARHETSRGLKPSR